MAFNSFYFWMLFPLIFAVYWLIPVNKTLTKKIFLILVSYLLYLNWNPVYSLILIWVTIITWLGGLFLRNRNVYIAILLSVLSLAPLLIFKYGDFLTQNLNELLSLLGLRFEFPGLNYAIPIGISFYSFQAIGYMLDVYHKRTSVERNLVDYTLFVSFFPQIMSGPISKSNELIPQIKQLRSFDYEMGKQGLKWLLWGMFIKIVIADRLGLFVDTVYSNYTHYNGATCFVASLFYTIQIYCDFCGYSLMAIGIAATLGFKLINNFRRPYFAVSVTDFWRRWHISLTRWLTQQVYIPLGGNRCSKVRNYWNIFLTFLVSGIWHGANWTFIFWGVFHGFIQIIEKFLGLTKYEGHNVVLKLSRIMFTFLLVNIAWIFFRMPTIKDAFEFISSFLYMNGLPDLSDFGGSALVMTTLSVLILFFKDCRDEFFPSRFKFLNIPFVRFSTYIVLFCMIIAFGVLDGGQFIYVKF